MSASINIFSRSFGSFIRILMTPSDSSNLSEIQRFFVLPVAGRWHDMDVRFSATDLVVGKDWVDLTHMLCSALFILDPESHTCVRDLRVQSQIQTIRCVLQHASMTATSSGISPSANRLRVATGSAIDGIQGSESLTVPFTAKSCKMCGNSVEEIHGRGRRPKWYTSGYCKEVCFSMSESGSLFVIKQSSVADSGEGLFVTNYVPLNSVFAISISGVLQAECTATDVLEDNGYFMLDYTPRDADSPDDIVVIDEHVSFRREIDKLVEGEMETESKSAHRSYPPLC